MQCVRLAPAILAFNYLILVVQFYSQTFCLGTFTQTSGAVLKHRMATRSRDSGVPAFLLWLFWGGGWRQEVCVAFKLVRSSALAALLWESHLSYLGGQAVGLMVQLLPRAFLKACSKSW